MLLVLVAFLGIVDGLATVVNVPVAIIIKEPTVLAYSFDLMTSGINVTSAVGGPWHAGIQVVHRVLEERGGLAINNQSFHPNSVVYNRAAWNGTDATFSSDVANGGAVFIVVEIATNVAMEDLTVAVARACATSTGCVVISGASVKHVFICTETITPECVGRPNLRRFNNLFSILPNSEYITESFLGRMSNKQQHSAIVVYNPIASFTVDASNMASTVAASFGISITNTFANQPITCNSSTIEQLVDAIRDTAPDLMIVVDSATNGACWVKILERMKELDYFPSGVALCGGVLTGVKGVLGASRKDLAEYIYNSQATMEGVTSFDYRATDTPTHMELFPATLNKTSATVYREQYIRLYGATLAASPYWPYSYFSASAMLALFHLIELSSGSTDPYVWHSVAAQINTPSIVGLIQFDSTGQNAGLRAQLLSQEYHDPDTLLWSSPIVSATSRYQDIFPAPTWSKRLYRSYFENGDVLRPTWEGDIVILLAAAAILFVGTTSGMFCLRATLKEQATGILRHVTPFQWLSLALSFGVAGQWAFLLIAFQGISFVATDPTVHASLHVNMPVVWAMCCVLLSLLVIPSAWLYMRIRRQSRKQSKGARTTTSSLSNNTSAADTSIVRLDQNTSRVHSSNLVYLQDEDEEGIDDSSRLQIDMANERAASITTDGEGDGLVLTNKAAVFYHRYRLIPLNIKLWLVLNGCAWIVGPLLMELLLLSSFRSTSVIPTLGAAIWIGYFLVGAVPMSIAFLLHGFVVSTDLLATVIQCVSLLLIYFVPIANTTFTYQVLSPNNQQVPVMSSLVGTLVPGLVSLFTAITFVIILLRKSGADNEHINQEKRNMMVQRNIAKYALTHALHDTDALRIEMGRCALYDTFVASQRLVFDDVKKFTQHQGRLTNHWKVLTNQLDSINATVDASRTLSDENTSQYIATVLSKRAERKKAKQAGATQATQVTSNKQHESSAQTTADTRTLQTVNAATVKVDMLMKHPLLTEWLHYGAKLGGSEENWYFLTALDAFERLPESLPVQRLEDAWSIYQLFIDSNAPMHINISSSMVRLIHTRLDSAVSEPPSGLFNAARQEVISLMQTNNIAPLCKIPLFVQTLQRT